MVGWMDGGMVVCMDGGMVVWNGWWDGGMDGWWDGGMDGWMSWQLGGEGSEHFSEMRPSRRKVRPHSAGALGRPTLPSHSDGLASRDVPQPPLRA